MPSTWAKPGGVKVKRMNSRGFSFFLAWAYDFHPYFNDAAALPAFTKKKARFAREKERAWALKQ